MKKGFINVVAAIGIAAGVVAGNVTDKEINGIEFVLVEAGTFVTKNRSPRNDESEYVEGVSVTIEEDFYISKFPITQTQYQAVMGTNPSIFSGRPDNPVENVTWSDAVEFCEKVGGFLPTEIQWEYAARGGNKSEGYIYSGSNDLDEVAWYWFNIPSQDSEDPGFGTQPVGQKKGNELGIHDMSGNIWEWTADWWSIPYPSGEPDGSGSGSSNRVIRGGYYNNATDWCNVSFRFPSHPDETDGVGFRVVLPCIPEETSIRTVGNRKNQDILKQTVVSDKMEIVVDKVSRVVIYDAVGNLVYDGNDRVWDLRNNAGRYVANGTYLAVVEMSDTNGKPTVYSAKFGVKR